MRLYRREKGIESENELVRQAIAKLLDSDYSDATLQLSALKGIQENVAKLENMISVLFSYQQMAHFNLLAYHPEIAEELKKPALASASLRHEKFFSAFRDRLRDDPPFFERLLHNYVAGDSDGQA